MRKQREESPAKIARLVVRDDREEDHYDTTTFVKDVAFGSAPVDTSVGNLEQVVSGVLAAISASTKQEINEWEQDIKPCEHVLTLQQPEKDTLQKAALSNCSQCDLSENLWLCLVCGNLGCGRAQFGGVGGNSHGLAHYEASGHSVSVKLGSITPEGSADVFCYKCSDEIKDPLLKEHLAHWGINIADQEKTEKSLTELQLEQNMKWDFSMTTDDGKDLEPLFGPELTGMKNLGNSCYLSSVVQCLFSLPAFKEAYYDPTGKDFQLVQNPSDDLQVQLRKLADGLLSGRYSLPGEDPSTRKGIAPATFKNLIGKGHEEFSTMRQQDAFEFLVYLLTKISEFSKKKKLADPTQIFDFQTDQRLECKNCHKVRYRTENQENLSLAVPSQVESEVEVDGKLEKQYKTVKLLECFDDFTKNEEVEFSCKSCGQSNGAVKKVGFKTFPNVLAVNARRFEIINWVPVKLDIPVEVTDETFSLNQYVSVRAPDGTEDVVSDDEDAGEDSNKFVPNESALQALQQMGFSVTRCEKALYNTGNSPDAEVAMNWLFAHMEDPDIDEPFVVPSSSPSSGPSNDQVSMLQDMGFSAPQARKALRECGGNPEAAVEWLFSNPTDPGEDEQEAASSEPEPERERGSAELPANYKLKAIICHKGRSVHAGHYVAFIRKPVDSTGQEEWTLFNDEKVVRGGEIAEMKKYAYIYLFERVKV